MDPRAVTPAYGVRSLADVVPSALGALGVPGWANPLDLPAAAAYVVLLVDGLGWNLLRRHGGVAPALSEYAERAVPITAGIPSTTATSLTSLGTGLPPGRHGVVGFTSRIPGTARLLDALRWDAQVDPLEWQPLPTAFERAAADGVTVSVVSKRAFERSGLTLAGQRGAAYAGADLSGERISITAARAAVEGSLTYVYEPDLDTTGHRYGCESVEWRMQLGVIDDWVRRLRSALPARAALVVVADHGMVDVPLAHRVDVAEEPELLDGVTVFGGEARLRHLYCDDVDPEGVRARWRERLGDEALVVTRDEAVAAGWFGPQVDERVRPRLGDVIVASIGSVAVVSSRAFAHEAKLIGLHGSVSPDEMLVPLLVSGAE